MVKESFFSMTDLQDFEELEILGGGQEDGSVIQEGCSNNVAGCAGCNVQDGCSNNESGCACEEDDKGEKGETKDD